MLSGMESFSMILSLFRCRNSFKRRMPCASSLSAEEWCPICILLHSWSTLQSCKSHLFHVCPECLSLTYDQLWLQPPDCIFCSSSNPLPDHHSFHWHWPEGHPRRLPIEHFHWRAPWHLSCCSTPYRSCSHQFSEWWGCFVLLGPSRYETLGWSFASSVPQMLLSSFLGWQDNFRLHILFQLQWCGCERSMLWKCFEIWPTSLIQEGPWSAMDFCQVGMKGVSVVLIS